MGEGDPRTTYLLVDGENIDATLGMSLLGRRPNPEERPRWDRVRDYVRDLWDQPVRPLFFLNASSGSFPTGFVQALIGLGFTPIPLAGAVGEKVVDIGIQRTLEAIGRRAGDVVLLSHDGDFIPQLRDLAGGDRKLGLLGFREFVNVRFQELAASGLQILDLEDDAAAFTAPLPRIRIIPIEQFQPERFL